MVDDDGILRAQLEDMLRDGLQTEWRERAATSELVNDVVGRLREVPAGDHAGRMRIAGFTMLPYAVEGEDIAQACETCMYYAIHRHFCELPELMLPVKPQWSCRLWRV